MKKFILFTICLIYGINGVAQDYKARYELINLGRNVNTGYHEGAPVISADGKMLYFFVHNHPENNNGKDGSQDIWYSELQPNGEWGKAKHMDKPLNQHNSNQVFTVMPDGKTLFIRGGSSKNSKGLSFTYFSGGRWSRPEEIEVDGFEALNKGKFYGATISSDGRHMLLYLSEKLNSTFSDIYMSKVTEDGTWSRPIKIGNNINTERDDFAPYLAPDNKTMYFSSNRKDKGIGKADIYRTVRLDDSWLKWADPVNVGRPLNTTAFDAYMSVDHLGNTFTAQSGNTIDGGNLDIFSLQLRDVNIKLRGIVLNQKTNAPVNATLAMENGAESDTLIENSSDGSYQTRLIGEGVYNIRVSADGFFPDQARLVLKNILNDTTVIQDFYLKPVKQNALITGTVYNAKTKEPLAATVAVSLKKNQEIAFKKFAPKGYFENELKHKGWYLLTASSEGFLNSTDSVANTQDDVTLINKDLYLTPIEVGTTVRLKNIFFDFDKTTLKPESFVALDKVVEFLKNNGTLEIEIAGHTDSKGSDDYNRELSQGRAEAVVHYLATNGVNDLRLVARGYGESVPLESNTTDEGRAINRRVEFTVLKK